MIGEDSRILARRFGVERLDRRADWDHEGGQDRCRRTWSRSNLYRRRQTPSRKIGLLETQFASPFPVPACSRIWLLKLHMLNPRTLRWRKRGNDPQRTNISMLSSAGRSLHTGEVAGSIPAAPTIASICLILRISPACKFGSNLRPRFRPRNHSDTSNFLAYLGLRLASPSSQARSPVASS
jgi:hypothetical protein